MKIKETEQERRLREEKIAAARPAHRPGFHLGYRSSLLNGKGRFIWEQAPNVMHIPGEPILFAGGLQPEDNIVLAIATLKPDDDTTYQRIIYTMQLKHSITGKWLDTMLAVLAEKRASDVETLKATILSYETLKVQVDVI